MPIQDKNGNTITAVQVIRNGVTTNITQVDVVRNGVTTTVFTSAAPPPPFFPPPPPFFPPPPPFFPAPPPFFPTPPPFFPPPPPFFTYGDAGQFPGAIPIVEELDETEEVDTHLVESNQESD
jgi:hypothetical protein